MRVKSLIPPSIAAVVVAVAALALAQGSASTPAASTAKPGSGKISISNFMYGPAAVSVKLGTTLVVTNRDGVEHTLTSDTGGSFDSGTLVKDQVAHIKLSKIGTFAYHCSFHAFMRGVVKVVQ